MSEPGHRVPGHLAGQAAPATVTDELDHAGQAGSAQSSGVLPATSVRHGEQRMDRIAVGPGEDQLPDRQPWEGSVLELVTDELGALR